MTPTTKNLRTVAALCVSGRSIYKHTAGVLAYDRARDARSFPGGMPVVAHPPCRCWSKFLSHQAKPVDRPGEMALGLWCVDQVLRHGGVLEHPAHSKLFEAAGLPRPGDLANPFLYTLYVEQWWFGFGSRKPTWVLISGCPSSELAPIPFRLENASQRNVCGMSRQEASRSVPAFANWLIESARATWHSLPVKHWTMPSDRSGELALMPKAWLSASAKSRARAGGVGTGDLAAAVGIRSGGRIGTRAQSLALGTVNPDDLAQAKSPAVGTCALAQQAA